MIFGHIDTTDFGACAHEGVRRALEYARAHDLATFEPGRHDIAGDALFVNVVEYDSKPFDACVFEAHRRYIDVHLVLAGEERIDAQFVGALPERPYDEEGDCLLFEEGEAAATCVLKPGCFSVCFPDDAHKPSIATGEPASVKKAIFKVLV